MRRITDPPTLPRRATDANKTSVGRVLVIGGSPPMAGAPALAGLGALRGGAGLVSIAVPQGIQATVAGFRAEATTAGLPQTRAGALGNAALPVLRQMAAHWDALVLGPGLGRAKSTVALVRALIRSVDKPLVIDADALFAFAGDAKALAARTAPTVITPHEGEAARLLGQESADVQADREAAALALAEASHAVVVLKGPGTLVACSDRLYTNATGGPALATGGTGDVLAGLTGALLAGGGLDAFQCACAAVHIHGAAGDAAAGDLDRGVLARDVADALPAALARLLEPRSS